MPIIGGNLVWRSWGWLVAEESLSISLKMNQTSPGRERGKVHQAEQLLLIAMLE